MMGFAASTQVLKALGAGIPVAINAKALTPGQPGILCLLSSGASLTYNIEVTGDDLEATGYNPANGNWSPLTNLTGLTASAVGTLGAVVTGIRANITVYVSGSLTFQFVQTRDA